MNQCLCCNKPCKADLDFCEGCRARLHNRLQQHDLLSKAFLPEQIIGTVLAAARNSRLVNARAVFAPLHNGEVNFKSAQALLTQMPVSKTINSDSPEEDDPGASEDLQEDDPLSTRHLPRSAESILIEQKDIQRAIEQGELVTQPASPPGPRLPGNRLKMMSRVPGHLRITFLLLVVVAIFALIADGFLMFFNTDHQPARATAAKVLPALIITPGAVHPDQIVLVQMSNFSPSAKIRLTRDIREGVRTDAGSPFITLGADGTGNVRMLVDNSWGPGSHTIEAEDVTTHYIASTVLQVLKDRPLRPPHLIISLPGTSAALRSPLNMGSSEQGANTLQSLVLRNTGGNWISWSAASNQPWLMTSPQQGIFRDSQTISVAVTRANLKPGGYNGTITLVSNGGPAVSLKVIMTVLPLSASDLAVSSVMLVTPPVLSFTSTDGGQDPASQFLTISNPGSQPLNWSLDISASQDAFNQNFYSQEDVNWLDTSSTVGTVFPGASAKIQVSVHSRVLLPSVYSALLTFTSGRDTLNTPQIVAVSLTVQSPCGVVTNLGNLSFTTSSGYYAFDQFLSLNTTSGCAGTIGWQSFSSAPWLSITPAKGRLQVNTSSLITVQVSAAALQPGKYTGVMLFVAPRRSQTLLVRLTVLSPPPTASTTPVSTPSITPVSTPSSPAVFGIGPGNFQFTMTQGQGNPPGQALTVGNTGGGSLFWQASINPSAASWLSVSNIGGKISPAQAVQIMLNVDGSNLTPGNYGTQITITATDNSGNQVQGSPQTVQVTLNVISACTLQVTPAALSFTAIYNHANPPGKNITLKTARCLQSVSWTASVDAGSQKWLVLSSKSGSIGGHDSTFVVNVKSRSLLPGVYTGLITITASSGGGAVQGSPTTVSVVLTVMP